MDVVKRIDELKKIIDNGKFETKYAGFSKVEVLLSQHVLTVCENIQGYGKDIVAKITFAYSDPKTGISTLSEMVIAKAGTPLQEIKEKAFLSVIGALKENPDVTSENTNKNISEENKTAETKKETEEPIQETVEETVTETEEQTIIDNSENNEIKDVTDSAKEEVENNENIEDVEDIEDVLTDNASEMFDNKTLPKNPLNEDFTGYEKTEDNVNDNVQNKEETKKETSDEKNVDDKIEKEINNISSDVTETSKKEENENTKEISDYKPKELDSIQKGEIDVLVKHLSANKDDRKEVVKKFFQRLNYEKGLKKENAEEITEILVKESQRLANRYTEETVNLMFDEAYKGLIPEETSENLLINIGNLKILAAATALAITEIVIHEMRWL
jgi:MATH and LRR domain-containing protein PFE0570w